MGEMDLAVGADVSHPAARGSMENSIGAGRSGPVRLRVFVRDLDTFKVARTTGRTLEAVGNGLHFRWRGPLWPLQQASLAKDQKG